LIVQKRIDKIEDWFTEGYEVKREELKLLAKSSTVYDRSSEQPVRR
jgi:hypothetical protein